MLLLITYLMEKEKGVNLSLNVGKGKPNSVLEIVNAFSKIVSIGDHP